MGTPIFRCKVFTGITQAAVENGPTHKLSNVSAAWTTGGGGDDGGVRETSGKRMQSTYPGKAEVIRKGSRQGCDLSEYQRLEVLNSGHLCKNGVSHS